MIRRLKQEVAKELPPKIETEIPCILNQEQLKTYKLLAEKGLLDHGSDLREAVKNSPTHVFLCLQDSDNAVAMFDSFPIK